MSEYPRIVKKAAATFTAQSLRTTNPTSAKEYKETAAALMLAAEEFERLIDLTTAIPRPLEKISDLPPSLIAELSTVKVDELEDQVVTVINAFGGTANIDEILVGLYRKFKVEQTRKFMLNKLYRMMKADLLYSLAGRKGLYSTQPPPEGASEPEEEDDVPPPKRTGKMGNPREDFSRPDFDDEIPF